MFAISIFFIIAFSSFVQTASGFGIALISTPLLINLLGIEVTAPLVALVAMLCRIVMLIHYHESFNFNEVWRLMVTATLGIPFGFFLYISLNKHTVEILLGVIIVGYALYSLISPKVPPMSDSRWAYGLGFIAGILGGAYNMGGMPAVIYGTGRRWSPKTFKGNLQLVALVTGTLIIITRGASGEYTPDVLGLLLIGTPATVLGAVVGFWSDAYLKGMIFRRGVLLLMLVI
ncbi:MAG TPA: sulfite exporter TauE/SafE family protein, partial [Aggregatilineales bacterium]|nr:sulfite exporter TauE/SafE family protein [Aggregatilineales bacterium]